MTFPPAIGKRTVGGGAAFVAVAGLFISGKVQVPSWIREGAERAVLWCGEQLFHNSFAISAGLLAMCVATDAWAIAAGVDDRLLPSSQRANRETWFVIACITLVVFIFAAPYAFGVVFFWVLFCCPIWCPFVYCCCCADNDNNNNNEE